MQLKRILSILLAAALIFTTSMVPVNAETIETIETFEVGVVAETTAPISISPTIYKSGDEVSVKISADQNAGITILKFSIKFDPNALEFVDYNSTNLFSNDVEGVYVYNDSICYTQMMNNASTATGEMLTLNFKVKDTFCGDTAIYAEVFDGQDKNCINGLDVVPFVGGRASFTAHAVNAETGVVIAPTCTEEGYTTYHCGICNEDIEGNILAPLGHTAGEAVEENHVAPTCTDNGAYDSVVYCSVCNAELSRETIAIDATGHTAGEAVEENHVAPTCTDNGAYDSVVYCSVCNVELSRETIVIDATGHTAGEPVEENHVAPTCTDNGAYDSVVYCSVCNAELSRETIVVDATGHTAGEAVEENHVAPTCIDNGAYDSVVYCSVCNAELSRETIVIDALGHDIITHEAQMPTCTEIGWDGYDTCSRCEYTTYAEILPLGHNPADIKEENRVEATCINDGSYDNVVYCLACNEELFRENKVIAALGHMYSDWTNDNDTTHKQTCSVCFDEKTADHSWDGGIITKEPKFRENGVKTYTCAVCSGTKTETIAATGVGVINPFKDVKLTQYFADPVLWAVSEGITNGTSATTFSPCESCTRGQVVTFLWRAAGSPEPKSTKNPFEDVKSDQYYYKAVLWAVENGITNGTSADTFSPDASCTRGQVATFLWRANGSPKVAMDNPFKDVGNAYYYDAVLWAVKNNITTGVSETQFAPDDTCTRAQIVTFLYRTYN